MATVIPLLFIGGLADLIGTAWVFVGVGVGLLLMLAILEQRGRRRGPLDGAPAVGTAEA